jgi:hypothetical protein
MEKNRYKRITALNISRMPALSPGLPNEWFEIFHKNNRCRRPQSTNNLKSKYSYGMYFFEKTSC